MQENFISFKAKSEFNKLSESRQYRTLRFVSAFYKAQVSYLERWLKSSDGTQIFGWCSLKQIVDWNDVLKSLDFIHQKVGMHPFKIINRDGVFDEINSFNGFIQKSLEKWNHETSVSQRWSELFQYGRENGLPVRNVELLV